MTNTILIITTTIVTITTKILTITTTLLTIQLHYLQYNYNSNNYNFNSIIITRETCQFKDCLIEKFNGSKACQKKSNEKQVLKMLNNFRIFCYVITLKTVVIHL